MWCPAGEPGIGADAGGPLVGDGQRPAGLCSRGGAGSGGSVSAPG